jgi:hypothetical protein
MDTDKLYTPLFLTILLSHWPVGHFQISIQESNNNLESVISAVGAKKHDFVVEHRRGEEKEVKFVFVDNKTSHKMQIHTLSQHDGAQKRK